MANTLKLPRQGAVGFIARLGRFDVLYHKEASHILTAEKEEQNYRNEDVERANMMALNTKTPGLVPFGRLAVGLL